MDGTATYVYCIMHAAAPPKTARVPPGLRGATRPSMAKVSRTLWLAVADVPLASYGPEPLETSLKDMQWVGDVAVAHEAVAEHFARQPRVTVIPMQLFTMFSSERRAVEETQSRRRDLEALAKRVAGCDEWGVRMTRRPAAVPPRRAVAATRASGAAFLAAKKEARDRAREARLAGADTADRAFAALAAIAREARRRDDAPEGATSPPLLDAAFLVPTARRARFKAAARRLAAGCANAGADMVLTGPWPAYNFVQPEPGS